jgi:hypothetical protein
MTHQIGALEDEDDIEAKFHKIKASLRDDDGVETPPGSDTENNPGQFLKYMEPLRAGRNRMTKV